MKAAKKANTSPGRGRDLLVAIILLGPMLAAYSNSWQAGFALDNRALILADPRTHLPTAENLQLILSHTYWWPYAETGLYRPFTTLSYLFNYAVLGNGADPAGYHAFNLLLHALNVLLAYALALRLLSDRWNAAAVAGLWAVHPVLVESVTNIVGRADLLAGAAILGGLWLHIRGAGAARAARFIWLACLAAVTLLGLFSKESALAVVGVLAIYEFSQPKRRALLRGLLPSLAAMLVPMLAMWWARSWVLASSARAVLPYTDNPLIAAGFWQAKLTAFAVLGRYMWLTLWPEHLSADYSYAQIALAHGGVADWGAWLTVASMLAVAAFVSSRPRKWHPAAMFFLLFIFVNLILVSNLLFPIGTIMAERFLYLPALGLCAFTVMLVNSRVRSSRLKAVLLALAIGGLGARTYARNADWRSDLSLAQADVKVSPGSYKTHLRLADALYQSDPEGRSLDNSIEEVERSLAIVGRLPDTWNTPTVYVSAGFYYLTKGERLLEKGSEGEIVTPASRAAYERSVQILNRCLSIIGALRTAGVNPAYSEESGVQRMLSADYLRLAEVPRAVASAREAVRLDPLNPQTFWQLFKVLMSQQRAFEAGTALMEGGIVTGDPSLRAELIRLYKAGLDPQGCAITPGSNALNPACEIVQKQICAAGAGLQQLAHQSPRSDIAPQLYRIPLAGCHM